MQGLAKLIREHAIMVIKGTTYFKKKYKDIVNLQTKHTHARQKKKKKKKKKKIIIIIIIIITKYKNKKYN